MTSALACCLALVAALALPAVGLVLPAPTSIARGGNRSVMVQLTVTRPVALAMLAPSSHIQD